jgi:AcrR family transcriptional regulator
VAEPLRRRDRVRAATVQEIKETARRVLVEQGSGGLSLRAVARDMGITAPALYRYFPSREDLLEHLIADLYDEVSAALERARDALPADDIAGRLLTVSRTFRAWALAHPAEFALLFGSPIKGFTRPHEAAAEPAATAGGAAAGAGTAAVAGGAAPGAEAAAGEDLAQQAGQRFGAVFAGLVAELYLDRRFPVPADDEIEPALRAQLEAWCSTLPEPLPLGVMQVFLSCWIRLYGSVCMEAFGHLRFAVADAEPMFEAELRSLAGQLGIASDYRRPPLLAESLGADHE